MDPTQGNYPNAIPVKAQEQIIQRQDPLLLTEDDTTLVRIVDNYDTKSKSYFSKIRLRDRQDRNFSYLFARGAAGADSLFDKKDKTTDNVIYEIESTLKPLATSKDPDVLVYPAQDTPQSTKSAADLTLALEHSLNQRDLKDIKALAFKHMPVYFLACVKYRWNPEKGKNGDYEFMVIHPQNLVLDNNAKGRDINKQDFVIEYMEVSVQELIMRFPDQEDALLQKLLSERKIKKTSDPAALSTKVKIMEVWFKYYEKKGGKYTKISSVLWKYKDLVFGKSKNPNWDWEGETNFFSYDDKIQPQQLIDATQQGQQIPGFNQKEVFHNYFTEPEFPYIFIGYDDWHTMIYDETSRIEQLIKLQENVTTRNAQITQMLNRAMGKHIFSTEANLKADDLEEMNWQDMDQAIIVDGNPNITHAMAAAEQPSAQIINDYSSNRQIMQQKAHVNALSGVLQSRTATSNQIAREANLTYASDLVDQTINYLSEKMARAILQMIKLRYTEDHFIRLIGNEGKVLFQRLHRDMIEDGMEVVITASGVDKLQAQNQAMDMAKLQLIDPLSFYEDTGKKNAPERAERLLTFLQSPDLYMSKYVMGLSTTQQQVGALNGQPPQLGQPTPVSGQPPQSGQAPAAPQANPQSQQPNPQVAMDIAQLQHGQIPQVPQQVDPGYAAALVQFLQSPEFAQLPPQIKQQIIQFAQAVQQRLGQLEQAGGQNHLSFGKPRAGPGQAAPNAQISSPVNTAQVPINPPPGAPVGSTRNIH